MGNPIWNTGPLSATISILSEKGTPQTATVTVPPAGRVSTEVTVTGPFATSVTCALDCAVSLVQWRIQGQTFAAAEYPPGLARCVATP